MLAIEYNPDLLKEYGRTFAHLNMVEFTLFLYIEKIGKLNLLDKDFREKLLEGKTFGQKIELARGLLEPSIIKKLETLRKERNMLAHSVVTRTVLNSFKIEDSDFKNIEFGDYVLGVKKNQKTLTVDYLKEVTNLAEKVTSDLLTLITGDANAEG